MPFCICFSELNSKAVKRYNLNNWDSVSQIVSNMAAYTIVILDGNKAVPEFAAISSEFSVKSWFIGILLKLDETGDYFLIGDNNGSSGDQLLIARGKVDILHFLIYRVI